MHCADLVTRVSLEYIWFHNCGHECSLEFSIKELLLKCTWSCKLPHILWPSYYQAEKWLELVTSKRWISIKWCIPQHVKQLATNTVDLVFLKCKHIRKSENWWKSTHQTIFHFSIAQGSRFCAAYTKLCVFVCGPWIQAVSEWQLGHKSQFCEAHHM